MNYLTKSYLDFILPLLIPQSQGNSIYSYLSSALILHTILLQFFLA
jgi:hypothetical protein